MANYLRVLCIPLTLGLVAAGCHDNASLPMESGDANILTAKGGVPGPPEESDKVAQAELSDGWVTDGPQSVTISTDSKTTFQIDSRPGFTSEIAMMTTRTDAQCVVVQNDGAVLRERLEDPARERTFVMEYNEKNDPSKHRMGTTWIDPADDKRIRLQLRSGLEGFGDLVVVKEDLGGGVTRYTWSGGAVRIWRLTGPGPKSDDILVCGNLDTVVVTVTQ